MEASQTLGEPGKAAQRGMPCRRDDAAVGVDGGADPQRFAPRVETEDLIAFDAPELEAKAVRAHVDDGERRRRRLGAGASHGRARLAEPAKR
jgi:hypothetical protein